MEDIPLRVDRLEEERHIDREEILQAIAALHLEVEKTRSEIILRLGDMGTRIDDKFVSKDTCTARCGNLSDDITSLRNTTSTLRTDVNSNKTRTDRMIAVATGVAATLALFKEKLGDLIKGIVS